MDLRDAIQRIALEWPSYGRPRITAELRRRGWTVNHKRVYRLMREDNLLCVRKRKFVVTTDSNHGRQVYPNLAREMVLTGIDQLWVADITYIRLQDEFVYLAVILDAYSRRVIGWALDRTLEDELTLAALRMALASAGHPAGAGASFRPRRRSTPQQRLHRSAEGARDRHQHAPQGQSVRQRGLRVVHEDLKYEEVYRKEYRDLAEARASIQRLPGEGLQPEAPALGARLSCRRRSSSRTCACRHRRRKHGSLYAFSQAWRNLSVRCGSQSLGNWAGVPPPVGRPRSPVQGRDGGARPAHRPR